MSNHLVFDIETIPQSKALLSEKQLLEIEKRCARSEIWSEDPHKAMALSPWFGRIITIGLYYPEKDVKKDITNENEEKLLEDFWGEIASFSGTFISYNGLSFDIPFIKIRSMVKKVPPTNEAFLQTKRYQAYPHFDVAQHISDWDSRARVSLDLVCDQLGIISPKDGDIKASNVYDAYLQGRLQEIGEYCVKDLLATYSAYQIIRRFRT